MRSRIRLGWCASRHDERSRVTPHGVVIFHVREGLCFAPDAVNPGDAVHSSHRHDVHVMHDLAWHVSTVCTALPDESYALPLDSDQHFTSTSAPDLNNGVRLTSSDDGMISAHIHAVSL
jgi:hypothetical protein